MGHVDGTNDGVGYGVKGENTDNPLAHIHQIPTVGVWGDAPHGTGVNGSTLGGVGVFGIAGSDTGTGVRGESSTNSTGFIAGTTDAAHFATHAGVFGESDNLGVYGSTTGANGTAVYGNGGDKGFAIRGDSTGCRGFIAGTTDASHFTMHAGVFGESDNLGVYGSTTGAKGTAVYGNGGEQGFGVRGDCKNGEAAIRGSSFGTGLAGEFIGDVEVSGDIRLKNQDCAEDFDISSVGTVEPGTVMVIEKDGALQISESAYDKRVAGVVSGAGNCKPGLILGRQHSAYKRMPIALLGKVWCKVDAQYASIEVGDLLTTSPTPGHAMKTIDALKAFGAVIGKALRPLEKGQGVILILIALQ